MSRTLPTFPRRSSIPGPPERHSTSHCHSECEAEESAFAGSGHRVEDSRFLTAECAVRNDNVVRKQVWEAGSKKSTTTSHCHSEREAEESAFAGSRHTVEDSRFLTAKCAVRNDNVVRKQVWEAGSKKSTTASIVIPNAKRRNLLLEAS